MINIKKIIVDSVVWIAAINKRENHFKKAKKILEWINNQEKYEIIVTNLIMAEILNNFARKIKRRKFLLRIIDIFEKHNKISLYYDDEKISKVAIEVVKKISGLSYVDATLAVVMESLECDWLISFDDDFQKIDMVRNKHLKSMPPNNLY